MYKVMYTRQSMTRMIRKQVYIEARHERELKRRARELGVSEAELIRRGIDALAVATPPLPRSDQAWREMLAYIRKRRMMRVPQTGRRWTREELYEERLQRYAR